jgi:hypothetical protein
VSLEGAAHACVHRRAWSAPVLARPFRAGGWEGCAVRVPGRWLGPARCDRPFGASGGRRPPRTGGLLRPSRSVLLRALGADGVRLFSRQVCRLYGQVTVPCGDVLRLGLGAARRRS